MAIELKSSIQNTDSGIFLRTVSPSLDTDIKKVSSTEQEKRIPLHEIPDSKRDLKEVPSVELSKKDLDTVVSKLNDYVEQQKRDIRFSVDSDTNKTIVKLLDSNGDVLKQIPSEEVLAILKGIERNKGLFFEKEV